MPPDDAADIERAPAEPATPEDLRAAKRAAFEALRVRERRIASQFNDPYGRDARAYKRAREDDAECARLLVAFNAARGDHEPATVPAIVFAEPATDAERAMTVDEWEMLETAAYSYASKHAPTFVKMVARYEALAEKCRTRANALRAGRVMP